MIKIYEFKLSLDGTKLFVHVAANKTAPTTDAKLSTLTISLDGDPNGLSSKAFGLYLSTLGIVSNTGTAEAPIWTVESEYEDEVAINIDLEEVGTAGGCTYLNQLYYLQVTASSEHSTCTSVQEVDAITFDKYPLYKVITCAMDTFVDCEPSKLAVEYLMKLKALEAYIGLGIDYREEINRYYDWLIHSVPLMEVQNRLRVSSRPNYKPCGCGK